MPGSTPARFSSRSSLRPMLVTIWMCTQEWSLICMRATALTLAACHSAFMESSWLTRSTTSRSSLLPRAGTLMRMSRTASAGVIRAPRSARTLTGVPGAASAPAGISSGSGVGVASSALIASAAYRLHAHGHDAPAEGEGVTEPAGVGPHVVDGDAGAAAVAVDRPPVAQVDAGVVDGVRVGQHAVGVGAPEQDVARLQIAVADALGHGDVRRHLVGRAPRDL